MQTRRTRDRDCVIMTNSGNTPRLEEGKTREEGGKKVAGERTDRKGQRQRREDKIIII